MIKFHKHIMIELKDNDFCFNLLGYAIKTETLNEAIQIIDLASEYKPLEFYLYKRKEELLKELDKIQNEIDILNY